MTYSRIVEITADGWPTFSIPQLNESYHSKYGARIESHHIYIKNGIATISKDTICVLEIGFGTGLNCFETILWAHKHKKHVHIYSVEKFPITTKEILTLKLKEQLTIHEYDMFTQMHTAEWNTSIQISEFVRLHKIHADICTHPTLPKHIDIVYFDAFAPSVDPEIWTKEVFEYIQLHMNPNSALVTYCVKGTVKRLLSEIGFTVSKKTGPPQGKREILHCLFSK